MPSDQTPCSKPKCRDQVFGRTCRVFFLVTHLAYGLWVMVPELLNWAQRLDLYCCVFTDDDHDHRCVSGHLRNC
jgi:hypothetical protein